MQKTPSFSLPRGMSVAYAAALLILLVSGAWYYQAQEEAVREKAIQKLTQIGALFTSIAAISAVIWQRDQNKHYRSRLAVENALRISAERNTITLRAIGDAVVVTDTERRIELLNPAAESLTGWTEAEARGRLVEEVFTIVNEETRQPVENPVAQVLREKQTVGLTNHSVLIAKNGSEHPIADSAAPIQDEGGIITGVVLVLRDQSASQNYRRLFQSMHAGFALHEIICDSAGKPIDGRFLDVNPAFEKMTGLEKHDVVGKRILEVFPGIEPQWIETYGRVALGGEAVRFTDYSPSLDKHFDVTAYRPQANRVATVFRDITETKRAEDALMRSEQKYRSLTDDVLDTSEAGIFILNADFKVVWINRATERFFGLRRTDVIGHEKRRLVYEMIGQIFEDPQTFKTKLFATYDNNTYTEKFECHVLAHDGDREERWLQHWSQPISAGLYAGGRIEHYYDITDRKLAEGGREQAREQLLQAQKMEAAGRLAGGVAHDFNNMLSVILGNAELAMVSLAADAPQRAELQEIIQAANRSAEVARQLLTFAKKQTIAPKALDLNKTVTEMLTMLRSLSGKKIDLTWLPETATAPVKMDPSQISQILTNLCTNARDAIADTGKITIETAITTFDEAYCATHPDLVPGRYVRLSVSDDGDGIAPETLPYLFEPFFTTKAAGKGTGLGLATIHGIVKQNNGAITVTSKIGHGTTFNLYLPYDEGTHETVAAVRDISIPQGKDETILVVDDNPAILTLTAMTLKQLGYTVLTANTPDDALKTATAHKEKLVLLITDVVMPGMNGLELARRLNDQNPDIKCLFMSGYTAPMIANNGISDPNMPIIQKPFSRQELAVHVRQALGGADITPP